MNKYISRKEAAEMLGVEDQTISNYITRGLISYKKIDRNIYVLREDLERYKDKIFLYQTNEACIDAALATQDAQLKRLHRNMRNMQNADSLNGELYTEARALLYEVINLYRDELLSPRASGICEHAMLLRPEADLISDLSDYHGLGKQHIRQALTKAFHTIRTRLKEQKEKQQRYHAHLEEQNAALHAQNLRKEHSSDISVSPGAVFKSDIFKARLIDLGVTVRCLNCLKSADIDTVADLVLFEKSQLLKFRNFGRKSLTELDDLLEDLGLHFGMRPDEIFCTYQYQKAPDFIYLHTGAEDQTKIHDFTDLEDEVVWTRRRIKDSDIEYVRTEKVAKLCK